MSPKFTIPTQQSTKKITHWLGFAGIIVLYFFVVRPIRVGFISVLITHLPPLIHNLPGVELRSSATAIILSVGEFASAQGKEFTYGLSFNSFFLFTSLGLWALQDVKKTFRYWL